MEVQPYLFFDGRCQEAIDFYRSALGAELLMLHRFSDSPDQSMIQPGMADKVMHATLKIGSTNVMASDGQCGGKPAFGGFSLSVTTPDVPSAEQLFNALAEGGQVQMPLGQTFWSPAFGMVADRFGVPWMVVAEHKPQA
jgi:PhnB protein